MSRGISGQTTSQMLVRFRADVLDLHPQVVVICGGTNDIAQNTGYISLPHILGNLVSMVELARANGIAPVLCSLLPAREFGWRKELEPAPLIIELNAMIREYARRENVPYVDYHAAMSEADGGMVAAYTYDEVHPTAAGYDVMEKILPPVVDAVLKNPKSIGGVNSRQGQNYKRAGECLFPRPLILAGRSQRPSVICPRDLIPGAAIHSCPVRRPLSSVYSARRPKYGCRCSVRPFRNAAGRGIRAVPASSCKPACSR